MKALISQDPGGPQTLTYGDLPDPVAGPGQVRIAVKVAGLNYPDLLMIEDKYQVRPPRPFAAGFEASGVIDQVGEGVTGLKVGDRVLRHGYFGAMAQLLVADVADVAVIPESMPFEDAAALPLTYLTAHYALTRRAQLKAGETSEPLRTPSGYHIVRLNELRGEAAQGLVEQTHARHILLKPTEIQDDATVEQRLRAVRERILKGEDFAGLAKTLSEDPGSATEGGDLGWTTPGTFVPEFDKALAALQQDEISQPFRSQFGWHIVQLLGRRQFDNTEEMRRQRAFMQLRESKAEEEIELWLRRLRDEAYVDVKT